MTERLTTQQAAKELGVCKQRVFSKLQQGHFPGAGVCECGRTIMIPREDIELDVKYRGSKKRRGTG